MAWECKSCHRSIRLDPDPRGCDDEPICWHCLYEHREALLAVCEAARKFVDRWPLSEAMDKAITAAKGQPMKGVN